MKYLILWLDERDWGTISIWMLLAPPLATAVLFILAVLGVPMRLLLGLPIGKPWDSAPYGLIPLAPILGVWAFCHYGWPRLVSWAKSPAVKKCEAHGETWRCEAPQSLPTPDPFLEAARQEVEIIAPSEP